MFGIILLVGFCCIVAIYIIKQPYMIKTFSTSDGGWGYKIFFCEQLIIFQEELPAVSKKISFPSERAARKTARLVVRKLKSNQNPGLTINELKSINEINILLLKNLTELR